MNMGEKPLISVIVPVYNVERYLDACLNSIKQQTYKKLEIIVIEDCSTDNSTQVLQAHLKDERIKLIQHDRNRGLSAARNSGMKAVTGTYMMFVDSDDIVDSGLVEACVKTALTTKADVITYDFTTFKDGISDTDLPYPTHTLKAQPFKIDNQYFNSPHFAWLKFIRSSLVHSSSLQFPINLYYEDWPFHWHLGLITKNIYQLPVNFYLYRQRTTSITGSTDKKLLDLFIIHAQVIALVKEYKATEVKSLLANKIRQSHWSILTFIDSDILKIAIKKAKEAEKLMHMNGYRNNLSVKNRLLSSIVCAPSSVARPALQLLRGTLRKKRELKIR
ncbi:glycosyltransferase family 2 protein [Psychrobacter sp. 72-O-c]|uniref:glycosyltransferase family 2 protein n=1 Tax=Psychrobacter sp. 72-O-c TaxID=2774125 RepID=UPI00191AA3BA|nr:glycosyltransferase family 2 protein [Psychrobacter sp. 72-O-c]